MAILDVQPVGRGATVRRFGWAATLGLHLMPAAATFVASLAIAPLVARLGLPIGFALTVAFALVLIPVELGLLLWAAYRATGGRSLRAIGAVQAYPRPIGRWWAIVPVVFAFAVALVVVLTPVATWFSDRLAWLYPDWLRYTYDSTAGVARPLLVASLLIALVVDGLMVPVVEELYFRGYLLARLPVAGVAAVPLSAALFALQHYWQPYNWLFIFVVQVVSTALVVRSRSVRLGIALHVLANSFGVVATLLAVLA